MKRYVLGFFLFLASFTGVQAQYAPVTQSYYNPTTHSAAFNHVPVGFNTYTPTPTSTPTNTPTPITNGGSYFQGPVSAYGFVVATTTATPGMFGNVLNQNCTVGGGIVVGVGPTWTPVPQAATQAIPNVVLNGKSLGAGTPVPTIVIAAGVATVTDTSNGYSVGDVVVVAAATPNSGVIGDLNGLHVITGQSTNFISFNTTCTGTAATSGTKMFWFSGVNSLNPTLIKNITRTAAGTYPIFWTNTQPNSFYRLSDAQGTDGAHNMWGCLHVTTNTTQSGIIFSANNAGSLAAFDATSQFSMSWQGIQ